MRKTVEVVKCDICNHKNKEIKEVKLDVIFTTEQTEGRGVEPYLQRKTLDICDPCKEHILKGNYIFGSGAMGFNTYGFAIKPEVKA